MRKSVYLSATNNMQYQYEQLVSCQLKNVALFEHIRMRRMHGLNYVSKVSFMVMNEYFSVPELILERQFKFIFISEPFDQTNTARSCYDEKIFERIKSVFVSSWHVLRDTMDLNKLFEEPFLSPPQNVVYDNLPLAPAFPLLPPISWGIVTLFQFLHRYGSIVIYYFILSVLMICNVHHITCYQYRKNSTGVVNIVSFILLIDLIISYIVCYGIGG